MRGTTAARRPGRGEATGLTSLLLLETTAAFGSLLVGALALLDFRVMPRARPGRIPRKRASVTIIVPARNESLNIAAWVRDARRQSYPAQRIVVADDCSQDATAQIVREAAGQDARVEVRSFGQPPRGWVGKNWAAHGAALGARSEWLLFSDADVRLSPLALASALAAAQELQADALSLSATLECDTWLERQIMPVVAALIFSGIPACLVNDDRVPTGLLAGGFMLVRREAYERIGGHRAVRASIAEDRDLGERFKAFGYRIRLIDGAALVRVRMYRNLAQMWEGWRKNFFEGARRNPWSALFFILACVFMLVLPVPVLLALGVRCLGRRLSDAETKLAAVCGVSVASTALVRAVRDRAIGFRTDIASIIATPIGGFFAAAVMAASAWRVLSGRGQRWKGRTIP